ncbi:MAG: bacteriocin [Ginsengibacter sp.]|jgi:bacteriocin-like protein
MKQLTKDEMKKVIGGLEAGGTCCAHDANWDNYTCKLSIDMAKENAEAFGNWCCDSCGTSYTRAKHTFIVMD